MAEIVEGKISYASPYPQPIPSLTEGYIGYRERTVSVPRHSVQLIHCLENILAPFF